MRIGHLELVITHLVDEIARAYTTISVDFVSWCVAFDFATSVIVLHTVYIVNRLIVFSLLLVWPGWVAVVTAQDEPADKASGSSTQIDFARDIQPILSENCYYCHGPDSEQRQAGLRLDVEEDAREWFEPGSSEDSELFLRVSSDDEGYKMPPPDSNRKLTPKQIELIGRWIDNGGRWGKHWAYVPVEKPDVKHATARSAPTNVIVGANAIDHFVGAKLAEHKMKFSPSADRRTLLRRVSIDLTGLPPTREQLQIFLQDNSENAYAKMVDRFLASPAYGERMAWNWLDAARYADSNGYQLDNDRTMWPWRDWVVKSYNNNMPYDQFSTWQLAGDLMPNPSAEQVLATGFNRNHPINGEGGRIPEENRVDYVMDMAETAGTVWMGMTFNCCRCHDHKYDQLTQRDYYSLFAFFNQTPVDGSGGNAQTKPVLAVPSPEQRLLRERLVAEITKLDQRLVVRRNELKQVQDEWESARRLKLTDQNMWVVAKTTSVASESGQLKVQADQSILAVKAESSVDTYRVKITAPLKTVSGIRLEVLPHKSMTKGGLSRSESSNFVLTDFQVNLRRANGTDRPESIKFLASMADFEQGTHLISKAIDDDPKSGWAVFNDQDMTRPREAVFTFANSLKLGDGDELEVVLAQQSIHENHTMGRFRLSLTSNKQPTLMSVDANLETALETDKSQRNAEQQQLLLSAHLNTDPAFTDLQRRVILANKKLSVLDQSIPNVMVMADQAKMRKSFRLDRGSYENPAEEVSARVPSMFEVRNPGKPLNRLDLANWIFDDANPLTARVSVNRLWAQVFGIGLVKTLEDFGVQGEPPSHPELLEWLSAEYRDSGWDTKHLFRVILNSRTYQQTSKSTVEAIELDPNNRLLGRAPRFRMPSWMLRDYALAASGRLVLKVGGPPVNAYQPAGVWEEASFGNKKYKPGQGNELYRRSLYTFWRRIAAPTMFFDNADRMTCSVKSFRTNTPLHALTTLNDVTFVESARLLAQRAMKAAAQNGSEKHGSNVSEDQSRLNIIYECLLSRQPSEEESKILLAALARTKAAFKKNPESAKRFVSIGESKAEESGNGIELASWTSLCLAVFNLDETLTRQ